MKMKVSDLLPYKIVRYQESTNAFLPQEAIIPLSQEKDTTVLCAVQEGDVVEEGQILATSRELHGSVIHSSVPGIVSKINYISDPDGRWVHAVKVRLQGEFSLHGKPKKTVDWKAFPPGTLRRILADNGVVNTFEPDMCDKESLDVLDRLGVSTDRSVAVIKWPHYEKLESDLQHGEIYHNFNGSDYRLMEKYSGRNMLFMDVKI